MPPKKKDWYWECESEKVLADTALKLVRSPEGWPDEGLAVVGLYWYYLNLMHLSPRIGYLLSDQGLPLTTADVANLLGRPVQVVDVVQAILLRTGLLSQDSDGTIYSRGMVKRMELRAKRQRAGKRGGEASRAVLLKQMVEQTVQQNVGITSSLSSQEDKEPPKPPPRDGGVGEGSFAQANGRAKPGLIDLAQKATFLRGWGTSPEEIARWTTHLADLLAAGIAAGVIDAELDRAGRMRSEPAWDFQKRLLEAGGNHEREDPLAGFRAAINDAGG
jgi:hypothetical protein